MIEETNEKGRLLVDYIWREGELVSQVRPMGIAANKEKAYFYHNDHLGTPLVMTDEKKHTVWKAEYTPFGSAKIKGMKALNNIRFPGQYFDTETGLNYNVARFYDPQSGRYNRVDPRHIEQMPENPYLYAYANPLKYIDERGEIPAVAWAIVIGGMTYVVATNYKACQQFAKKLQDRDKKIGNTGQQPSSVCPSNAPPSAPQCIPVPPSNNNTAPHSPNTTPQPSSKYSTSTSGQSVNYHEPTIVNGD